jgi:hypothetical protein
VNANCVACGAETGADAVRCPSCGLAFKPAAEGSFVPPPAPAHVGLYLGTVPTTVAAGDDAAGAESPTPPPTPAAARRARGPWRIARVAIAVAAALGGAVALYLATSRPDDSWTDLEIAYARYAHSDAIPDAAAIADLDPDAMLREIERARPDECAVARRSHRPLAVPAGASIHEWTEALVPRIAEISPDWAHELGVPAASEGITGEDVTTRARWLLLACDAWKTVIAWRKRGDLTPHDRADGDALLGWLDDMLRGPADEDAYVLAWIRGAFDGLPRLEIDETSPARVRAGRAATFLRDVTSRLPSAVETLRRPPRAAVGDAAAALESAQRHLLEYPASWSGLSESDAADLGAAAAAARSAAGACAARLRNDIAARSSGPSGMGTEALASSLRVLHRLDLTPRAAYDRAHDELRAADDELRPLWRAVGAGGGGERLVRDESGISELEAAVPRWVHDAPADPLPRIRAAPTLWAHETAGAWYMDPGRLVPAGTAVVLVAAKSEGQDADRRRVWDMPRSHMFAHETYPGHRLQALFARSSCVVRRLVNDRMYVEGWARYAEDLIHETGTCREERQLDDFARALMRRGNALAALNAILVATGAADDAAVLALRRDSGYRGGTLDDVGAIAAWGEYPLGYLAGADEVRALRREEEERLGAGFDLRAFHTRLLREGPIPIPLIRRQWREERER